jgi:hypothetical protein
LGQHPGNFASQTFNNPISANLIRFGRLICSRKRDFLPAFFKVGRRDLFIPLLFKREGFALIRNVLLK